MPACSGGASFFPTATSFDTTSPDLRAGQLFGRPSADGNSLMAAAPALQVASAAPAVRGGAQAAFTSAEQPHNELAFKLGLPAWYGRNFDALLDCLSSIDDQHESLCTHWELHPGKRMASQVKGLPDL